MIREIIKIDYLSEPTIGLNQSGMKTQIDTLNKYLKNDTRLNLSYYDIWQPLIPDIIHYFGMGEGMIDVLKKMKSYGSKIICSPNHWPVDSRIDKILMNINFKNVIYSNRNTKKYLIDNADLFIVNSKAEKMMFVNSFDIDSNKIYVVYNSYGDEPFIIDKPIFRNKYTIKGTFALMAGQIGSKRKNQLPVIKNWKMEYPDLVILGGYDKTEYGKTCMAEIEKRENVKYLGYESNPLILESAYQHCELFISPGLIETPSLSAFRALMNGAKVCSTNHGGAPLEYFGRNVKYFNPYNEKEIAECIENSLEIPKWEINFHKFRQFSINSVCDKYRDIYIDLINSVTV